MYVMLYSSVDPPPSPPLLSLPQVRLGFRAAAAPKHPVLQAEAHAVESLDLAAVRGCTEAH